MHTCFWTIKTKSLRINTDINQQEHMFVMGNSKTMFNICLSGVKYIFWQQHVLHTHDEKHVAAAAAAAAADVVG